MSIRKEKEEDVWNIGFWTHPSQQGKGYMSEAVEALIRFGFEQLNDRQLWPLLQNRNFGLLSSLDGIDTKVFGKF